MLNFSSLSSFISCIHCCMRSFYGELWFDFSVYRNLMALTIILIYFFLRSFCGFCYKIFRIKRPCISLVFIVFFPSFYKINLFLWFIRFWYYQGLGDIILWNKGKWFCTCFSLIFVRVLQNDRIMNEWKMRKHVICEKKTDTSQKQI